METLYIIQGLNYYPRFQWVELYIIQGTYQLYISNKKKLIYPAHLGTKQIVKHNHHRRCQCSLAIMVCTNQGHRGELIK